MPGIEKRKWGFKHTAKKLATSAQNAIIERYAPEKGFQYKKLLKDVLRIKALINVEKKRFIFSPSSQGSLGQLFGNSNGYLCEDITPNVGVGSGYMQRSGSSIKLTGMYMKLQLYHLSNTTQPVKCKLMIFHVKGAPLASPSTEMTNILNPNEWIAQYNSGHLLYDYNSLRNPDYMGQAKLVKQKTFTVSKDSLSGQIVIKDVIVKLKLKDHVRYDGDTTNVTSGQWFYCIVADSGNIHNSTASTLIGLPTTQVSSGLAVNRTATFYYVDN